MLYNNKIVLLDEAARAMDHAVEEKLRVVLRKDMFGKTVILVAHRPEMIQECDVVIEMDVGRAIKVKGR